MKKSNYVAFDFDGVIINSEIHCYSWWASLFDKHGLCIHRQYFATLIGTDYEQVLIDQINRVSYRAPSHWELLKTARRSSIRSHICLESTSHILAQLFSSLEYHGCEFCIVSSSTEEWITEWLKLHRIEKYFPAKKIHCRKNGHDAKFSKKSAYQKFACQAFPNKPYCVEDSEHGIKSVSEDSFQLIVLKNILLDQKRIKDMRFQTVTSIEEVLKLLNLHQKIAE